MAMNMEAVLRIAAKVVGLDEVTALERGLAGAEKAAGEAQGAFKAVVSSASWQAAAAGAAGLAVALGTSAKAAMDFESSMADVRKVVPGLDSAEGLKAMKDEILNLSRVLPVSAEGLAEIMAAAGQAGIAREELGQFTKQAAQMGIAFDISAAEAGESMAKLRTSLGLSQDEVVNLADAMNYLSNNMASSAAEIVDFMKRSGAVGKQVAMTTEQTAAFGSAMIAAGAAPEVAATSFNNLIKAMAKGESVTERQGAAFKRLGLEAVNVAKSMQTDAVGTIRDVFQRISQMPAEMRITTISEIFGDEARALTPLITNLKLFDQAMGLVGDSSQYTGSMLEEFNARAGTSANNWQLLQNNLKALQIVIGEALLPAINLTLEVLTPLISLVSNLAGQFPALTAVIVGLTAAVSAFVIVAPGIVSAITLFGSLKAAIVAMNIGGLIAGFAGLGSAIIGALAPVLAWITGTLIPGLLAVFSGPVGWTVLAIAAVVAMAIAFREPLWEFITWLWEWGEPVREFWAGLWNGLVEFVGFSLGTVETVITTAANLWWSALETVWGTISEGFNTLVVTPINDAWTAVMEIMPKTMQAVADTVEGIWTALVETIKSVINGMLQYIAGQINAAIELVNYVISGYNSIPVAPDIPTLGYVSVPTFAQGGTVNRPTLAMVGEGGEREYIVPESKMATASARYLSGARGADVIPSSSAGSGSASSAPVINVTTGPVMEFDGQRYVRMEDFDRGMRQVADGVIGRLRTPSARIALGRA